MQPRVEFRDKKTPIAMRAIVQQVSRDATMTRPALNCAAIDAEEITCLLSIDEVFPHDIASMEWSSSKS
jgi:hypothetical protein